MITHDIKDKNFSDQANALFFFNELENLLKKNTNINDIKLFSDKFNDKHILYYILQSKNNIAYEIVMSKYKENIVFNNLNDYFDVLMELVNQNRIEDFNYFINRKPENNITTIYNFDILCDLLLRKTLSYKKSNFYESLLKSNIIEDMSFKNISDNFITKNWFYNVDFFKKSPEEILLNLTYEKSKRSISFYKNIKSILLNERLDFFSKKMIVNIISESKKERTCSDIVEELEKIDKIQFPEDVNNIILKDYLKNNVVNNKGFSKEENNKISNIIKKFPEEKLIYIVLDFLSNVNNIYGEGEYPFVVNKKGADLFNLFFEEYKNNIYDFIQTLIRSLLNERVPNLESVYKLYKNFNLEVEAYDIYALNYHTIWCYENNDKKEKIFDLISPPKYQKIHEKNINKIKEMFNKENKTESTLIKECSISSFYACSKEEEETILTNDSDHLSIFKELIAIFIFTKNINYIKIKSKAICSKIDSFLEKTHIFENGEKEDLKDKIKHIKEEPNLETKSKLYNNLCEKLDLELLVKNNKEKNFNIKRL